MSISLVPGNLAPAALPADLNFGQLVTIQPVGVTFSQPAQIGLPNLDELPPGSEVDIWSLDVGTGRFVVVGTGRVSADGMRIDTISGGIRASDWHAGASPGVIASPAPNNSTNQDPSDDCVAQTGSRTSLGDGNLEVDHLLPPYVSQNQPQTLRFVYRSRAADPVAILKSDSTLPLKAAVPQEVSMRAKPGGTALGGEVFVDPSALSAGDAFRQGIGIDASFLPTGRYPVEAIFESHFLVSSTATRFRDQVLILNERESPFGAGWMLDRLERLFPGSAGEMIHAGGDGSIRVFAPAMAGTGNFFGSVSIPTEASPQRAAVGDFDKDGILDVAVVRTARNFDRRMAVFRGIDDGGFTLSDELELNSEAFGVVAADFNGDDTLDLVAGGARFHYAQGNPAGGFMDPVTAFSGLSQAVDVGAADFTGDGHLDLAIVQQGANNVALFGGDGAGGFAFQENTSTGNFPQELALTDLNNDGRMDLAVANLSTNDVTILLGADWILRDPARRSHGPPRRFPGRGRFQSRSDSRSRGGRQRRGRVRPRRPDSLRGWVGGFSEPVGLFPIGNARAIAAADIDGDGFDDLFTASSTGQTSQFLGNGAGGFGFPFSLETGAGVSQLLTHDFNGDGFPDLLAVDSAGSSLSVLYADGSLSVQATPSYAAIP